MLSIFHIWKSLAFSHVRIREYRAQYIFPLFFLLFSGGLIVSYSDYIVYVDESGDPNLTGVNKKYPVFVLSFCIFHKKYYQNTVIQSVMALKFKHFGHDMVVLHERDILKNTGQFKGILKAQQQVLINDLSTIMTNTKFVLVSCVIHKDKLISRYANPTDPYHLGIQYGLERVYGFLKEKNQLNKITHVVFEQRGKNEDDDVREEFDLYCRGQNYHKKIYPFELVMASKQVNSTGLQFADLVSRPIGNHVLKPTQSNRAFDIIEHKFYCQYGRGMTGMCYKGYGLKIFP